MIPTRSTRRVAAIAIAATAMTAALLTPPGDAKAEPEVGERVVVIVPGQQLYAGPAENERTFGAMASALRGAGYRVVFAHASGRDVEADARLVGRALAPYDAADSVGVVAHSAGGLGARHHLKVGSGADVVDEYVAIGTAQYGSPGGCSQPRDAGYDTCMYSEAIAALNEGPDAPGPTRYSVVQSDGEWSDGRLDGTAQCRAYSPVPLANTGFDHVIEVGDPTIIARVVTSLRGGCAGTVATDAVDSFDWQSTLFPGVVEPFGSAIRDAVPRAVPAPR